MLDPFDIHHKYKNIEPIQKGWSSDKKYRMVATDGKPLLLRVSDITAYEEKKSEFQLMHKFYETGLKMSQPIEFGICDDGKHVYQILSWIEGSEAKEVLPLMTDKEQYAYGWKAGEMMHLMEQVQCHPASDEWSSIYGERVAQYLKNYQSCGHHILGEELLLPFLLAHKDSPKNRPLALLHADFQTDNMVISPDGELYAIDFQGSGIVDPYFALTGVMVSAEGSKPFAIGQLQNYFGGLVPDDFWILNAYYMAAESINAFTVAVQLGQEEIDYSNEMSKATLLWFDNLNHLVPSWYKPMKR